MSAVVWCGGGGFRSERQTAGSACVPVRSFALVSFFVGVCLGSVWGVLPCGLWFVWFVCACGCVWVCVGVRAGVCGCACVRACVRASSLSCVVSSLGTPASYFSVFLLAPSSFFVPLFRAQPASQPASQQAS